MIEPQQIERAIEIAKGYSATRLILFGSAVTRPEEAHDLDLACTGVDGWKLYELGARLEEELHVPLDLIPLEPRTSLTWAIEAQGRILL